MAQIRTLTVGIGVDLSKLQSGLNQAKKELSTFGRNMTSAGKTLTSAITVPLAGMATALGKVGLDFDDAFDKIRTGTGATGDALKGLQDDFTTVMKLVPDNMDAVSTAIADLNTRTGLTGTALQDLSIQFLDLARVTGEDVAATIESSTRLFGDWSVAAEDSASTLDYIFKVSQSTGVGINDLSDKLVQFGAPLRQMGFDFETSAAMIGKFEKEGVNTELVLGGLRIALGKMAREGITDTSAALTEVIERIKSAGSVGEANAIALDLFGAKIGPDMAAAIREGRFELTDFVSDLKASGETVGKAADDTAGFSEKMAIFRNQLLTTVEPLGTKLIEALDVAMPAIQSLVDGIKKVVDWFINLSPQTQKFIVMALLLAAALGPVLMIFGSIATGIASIIPLVSLVIGGIGAITGAVGGALTAIGGFFGIAAGPLGWAILALVALTALFFRFKDDIAAALDVAIEKVSGVMAGIVEYFSGMKDRVAERIGEMKDEIGDRIDQIKTFFSELPENIRKFLDQVVEKFVEFKEDISGKMDLVKETVSEAVEKIRDFFSEMPGKIWTHLLEAFNKVKHWGTDTLAKAKEIGTNVVTAIVSFIATLPGKVWTTLVETVGKLAASIVNFTSQAKAIGTSILNGIIDLVKGIPAKTSEWLTTSIGKITGLLSSAKTAATKFGNTIVDAIIGIVDDLPGKVWNWISKAIDKVSSGIRTIATKIKEFFSGESGGSVKITIPAYASGGIVRKPTVALVGEAGAEAIVPLDQMQRMTGNTAVAAGPGISVNFYAPVYGLLDFEQQVKSIVKEAAVNGAFRGVL